jgi:carbamate kinase
MRIVIALGGNALLPKGSGTARDQMEAARKALSKLTRLLRNHQVALTHGNGPQVGSLLLQQHATKKVPEMPLDVLDAMTQGEIGYFLALCLPEKSAVLITRAAVDEKDPAMKHPSKPVGPFYKTKPRKGTYAMDSGRGWRLLVPSPMPKKILERDAIVSLLESGFIVVCGGGGGIPVSLRGKGVEAVIDKDNFSSLLASEIRAQMLIFITSVPCAYTDFQLKANKRPIGKIRVKEMRRLVRGNHFAQGSMKPKVEAAIRFIEKGGKQAVICSIGNIRKALHGQAGTILQ